MKNKIFTDYEIKNLKPSIGQARFKDIREPGSKGFGISIFPSGEKSFFYIYTFKARKRRMTLCKYDGGGSLATARRLYEEAKSKVKSGIDPADVKQLQKLDERDASTLDELIKIYVEKYAKIHKRSWKEDKRILNKEIPKAWLNRKAKDITDKMIIKIIDDIVDRGAPIAANRTFACIRKMYNFAKKRRITDLNPCADIGAPSKENRRDRVLSVKEIQILCNNLRDKTIEPDAKIHIMIDRSTRIAILFQLATIQRKGEVLGLAWNEIDFDARWWTIPAAKAKNGLAHRIYLSDHALNLLNEAKRINDEVFKYKITNLNKTKRKSDDEKRIIAKRYKHALQWVFPSWTTGSHLASSAPIRALARCTFEKGLEDHHCHDLRRSGASHMTAMGISRLVVQKILNHVDGGVTAIYDRHSYDEEKKLALEAWGRRLLHIIDGTNQDNNVLTLSDFKEFKRVTG